jgi:hypothetical protein
LPSAVQMLGCLEMFSQTGLSAPLLCENASYIIENNIALNQIKWWNHFLCAESWYHHTSPLPFGPENDRLRLDFSLNGNQFSERTCLARFRFQLFELSRIVRSVYTGYSMGP